MRAQTLPAAAGWRWLAEAYVIYRRNPAFLLLMVAGYWFTILLLDVVPFIGVIVASLVQPVLGVGVMNACRELDSNEPVAPKMLFSGFRQNPRPLMVLGGLYLVTMLGILGLSALADGGELMKFMLSGKPLDQETLDKGGVLAPLLMTSLLVPVVMAWWYAPLLVAWHRLSIPKALFFSLVACWLNWRAFFMYALALMLYGVALPATVLVIASGLGSGAASLASAAVSIPLFMVFLPVFFASFYVTYRDVFGVSERV